MVVVFQFEIALDKEFVPLLELVHLESHRLYFVSHKPELQSLTGELFPSDLELCLQLDDLSSGVHMALFLLPLLTHLFFSFGHHLSDFLHI